jgi:hypothetical protein
MPARNQAALKRMTVVLGTACWGAVLFGSAGRMDWLRDWICLTLYFGGVSAAFVVIRIANPELIAARGTKHANTKPFDKAFGGIYTVVMSPCHCGGPGCGAVRLVSHGSADAVRRSCDFHLGDGSHIGVHGREPIP